MFFLLSFHPNKKNIILLEYLDTDITIIYITNENVGDKMKMGDLTNCDCF